MADTKRPLDINTLWKIERVGGLALAPDGAQAVCTVSAYSMDDNKGATSLWLLSTFGGAPRRLTTGGEKDGQPAWSPDGTQIAFVARRQDNAAGRTDETPQLYLIAADGGEARRISDFAPGIEAFKWLPGSRRIAFAAWVWPDLKGTKAQLRRHKEFTGRKETAYVTSAAQYRFWDHQLPMGRALHLHLLDIASGRVTDLFEGSRFELSPGDISADAFDVAPDGRHIVFAHDPAAEKRLGNCQALAELDLRKGTIRSIAVDAAWDFDAPRYSPDGADIAFIATNIGKRHTLPGHAALLERGAAGDGSNWELLSGAWDHAVEAPLRWAEDAGALYFTADDRGRRHLYAYTIASRTAAVAVEGGWVHGFDRAGGVLVSAADGFDHPVRVHARRDGGAAPLRIETFNDTLLGKLRFGRHEEVSVRGAGGEPVQMWLVYPPGFDRRSKKKKYPLLHNIHGGPHAAAADTFHYRWNSHLFAARGYVVACVNYHGSSGFGHAFLDSITHRWGELELRDVEAATDWLLGQPWADKSRVFASGGSYGGFMVAWMNGHVAPGRYNAYVCHAGCFDWTAMFSDDAYLWHARELGAWYWDDAGRIRSQSPNSFAGAMQTPTLVIHGALDYRVPDQQGLAYYNTLKARGVDARLVWFPDENHWVLKPRNSKLWYEEFFGWLKAHEVRPKRAGARSGRQPPAAASASR